MRASCVDPSKGWLLKRYLERHLAGAPSFEFELHLLECDDCFTRLRKRLQGRNLRRFPWSVDRVSTPERWN